jgi:hypothetical protein
MKICFKSESCSWGHPGAADAIRVKICCMMSRKAFRYQYSYMLVLCKLRKKIYFTFFKFLEVCWDWGHLVRRPIIGLLYHPRMIGEYGTFSGMRIGREAEALGEKTAPVPLCLPQTAHDLTWDRTRAAAVGSRTLISWAMARHMFLLLLRK